MTLVVLCPSSSATRSARPVPAGSSQSRAAGCEAWRRGRSLLSRASPVAAPPAGGLHGPPPAGTTVTGGAHPGRLHRRGGIADYARTQPSRLHSRARPIGRGVGRQVAECRTSHPPEQHAGHGDLQLDPRGRRAVADPRQRPRSRSRHRQPRHGTRLHPDRTLNASTSRDPLGLGLATMATGSEHTKTRKLAMISHPEITPGTVAARAP